MLYHTSFVSEGIDLKAISKRNVKQAFVVNLPFRLKIGKELKLRFKIDEKVLVVFRNNIDIPDKATWEEMYLKFIRWEKLWTRVLILLESPSFNDADLKATMESGQINLTDNSFTALQILNRAILAYSTATKEIFGGNPIQLLSDIEFFKYLEWKIDFVVHEEELIEDSNIDELFNLTPEKRWIVGGQYYGTMEDLPKNIIDNIDSYIEKTQMNIFYEFAFIAKSKMVERDFTGALLMAVVALEGVHAAYLRKYLTGKLHELGNKAPGLISDFLREQGFYMLIQVSPYLFLPERFRPEKEVIENCLKGVTMRNSIMHALTDSKGKYKVRGYKNIDISNSYSAVLEVYDCFVKAFEDN